jgi:SAM-dependent methyltransferase
MTKRSQGLEERVRREREAHIDNGVQVAGARFARMFPHLGTYPSMLRLYQEREEYIRGASGKVVLDYGCGRGWLSMDLLRHGARVSGVDISPPYIEQANASAAAAGFAPDRYTFQVMDAHALEFPDSTFDLVIGDGVLHHLQMDVALAELHRVVKPGCSVVFKEPLADNPLLKLYRWLTPNCRTADERPISGRDLRGLANSGCWECRMSFCGLVEAPAAMLTSVALRGAPRNAILAVADKIETWLHVRGALLPCNQYVLMDLRKVK